MNTAVYTILLYNVTESSLREDEAGDVGFGCGRKTPEVIKGTAVRSNKDCERGGNRTRDKGGGTFGWNHCANPRPPRDR